MSEATEISKGLKNKRNSIHHLIHFTKNIPEDSMMDWHTHVLEVTAHMVPKENTVTYHWLGASAEILPTSDTEECGLEIKAFVLKERLLVVEEPWLLWFSVYFHLLKT